METLITFMQSTAGRVVRMAIGAGLIALGAFAVQGVWSLVLAAIGLLPLFAGLIGVCLIAPLFGYTLTGERRARHASS